MTTVSEAALATEVVDVVRDDVLDDVRVVTAPTTYTRRWAGIFRACVVTGDFAAAAAGLFAVLVLGGDVGDIIAGIAVSSAWFLCSVVVGAYDRTSLPDLTEDLASVMRTTVTVLAAAGFVAVASQSVAMRSAIVVGLPVTVASAGLVRLAGHRALWTARERGRCLHRTVVVASEEEALDLIGRMRRDTHAGLKPVAACVPGAGNRLSLVRHQVPVAGDVWEAVAAAQQFDADTVVVGSGTGIDATVVRRLAWQLEDLEGRPVHLVVAPPISETYRGRLALRSLSAGPVVHVAKRTGSRVTRVVKVVFERLVATAALVVLTPVLLGIGLAIRLSSDGPALYRQTRVGKNGEEFTLIKFRTMIDEADALVHELGHLNVRSEGVLFKIPRDPRVTKVGAWLRRMSLDELPQLVHVVSAAPFVVNVLNAAVAGSIAAIVAMGVVGAGGAAAIAAAAAGR